MRVAREQLSTAMIDHSECSEPVKLQFENPVWVIKGLPPELKRHGPELQRHCKQNSSSVDECSTGSGTVPLFRSSFPPVIGKFSEQHADGGTNHAYDDLRCVSIEPLEDTTFV
jgi:hypothetical protein